MIAAFHTLGCKTNAYETQAVIRDFREAGFSIGDFAEANDVYVINTCAVTQEAARKSRQISRRCRRQNPDAIVVVTGCYAQDAGAALLEDGSADLVVGNSEKSRILPLVQKMLEAREGKEPGTAEATDNAGEKGFAGILEILDLTRWTEYERQTITEQEDHARAYVKIQDGCNRFCSYCLIPFLRGRSRSRSREDILEEVSLLAAKGYQEVVLTGIDISTFCFRPEENAAKEADPGNDLAELMEEISSIPGIRRIRLGSLEAGVASEKMVERLRRVDAFCPQFHLSLQSGSDSVLKRMNRHYTAAEFAATVSMIRQKFPNAAITTDVITGFPGETEEEFAETQAFVRSIGFSRMHVFPYSRRPKTRADQMPGQLTKALKEKRARELIQIGEELRQQYESRLIGKPCEILAEEVVAGKDGELYLAGYTPEYVRILVKTEEADPSSNINQFLQVIPVQFADGVLKA